MLKQILIVEDDEQGRQALERSLKLAGYQCLTAIHAEEGLDLLRRNRGNLGLVISDIRMPGMSGVDFLKAIRACDDQIPVVLMTAFGTVADAVQAMKLGAVDFLTKPFKRTELLTVVETAFARVATHQSVSQESLLGDSAVMQSLREQIVKVAPSNVSVLIRGESGSGKELVARALHAQSTRAQAAFVAINCAAVPEDLMEAELFGFERGAFTGATQSKVGLFEAANGGTLFLDEVGDMPLHLQVKLLRVLQEGEIRRLGATQPIPVNVRVVAATHRNLNQAIAAGEFREDLLFRLEVIRLEVPPLRERLEDLVPLIQHLAGPGGVLIDQAALDLLMSYRWPGNVRELSNLVERALVLGQNRRITVQDLPESFLQSVQGMQGVSKPSKTARAINIAVGTPLKEVTDLMIAQALEATHGDKNLAAKLLGINSRTIYRWLEKLSLTEVEFPSDSTKNP